MLTSNEAGVRTEYWQPGVSPGIEVHPYWPQSGRVTENSGIRRHLQSANHSRSNYRTSPTLTILPPDHHKPSTPHLTHPTHINHHINICGNQNDSLWQVPYVDKECKRSNDILGIDQIHNQYWQIASTNNEDTSWYNTRIVYGTRVLYD